MRKIIISALLLGVCFFDNLCARYSQHLGQSRTTKIRVADEFSFMIMPSGINGVGVFATCDIPMNTKLMVTPYEYRTRIMHKKDIPQLFTRYCTAIEDNIYRCPQHFNMMPLECYWNHSNNPNVQVRPDGYYSIKDIQAGQEIFINYNELHEPVQMKESFYAK